MSLLGIDVSNNNGVVNLSQGKSWGVRFVVAKASQGVHFTDGCFGSNRAQAARLGLPFGAYHFYDPTSGSETDQADHFCAIVQKLNATDIRPMIDFETGYTASGATKLANVQLFNKRVKEKLGVWPLFYSYTSFIHALGWTKAAGDGLVLSDFQADDGQEHPFTVPAPWKKAVIHQFSSKGRVPGVSGYCDLDYAHGKLPYAHPVRARLAKLI